MQHVGNALPFHDDWDGTRRIVEGIKDEAAVRRVFKGADVAMLHMLTSRLWLLSAFGSSSLCPSILAASVLSYLYQESISLLMQ
ncbi:hypothetical protein [uncultured Senegalimassilia sp.]|uniref:hypothetical protein n=1 Tax=uncultured Senegalimassilia sp. TaxID=1714350 RepID=UPI0025D3C423|nr:hypothetical protein [uncultured Senegalimassilia sp.]